MKKKLLKFFKIILIFFKGTFSVQANEKVILPKSKPVITKEQKSNKVANYLIPPKKPILKLEEVKTKKVEKLIVNGEIIPPSKPLVVKKEKSVRAKKSNIIQKDYEIAKIAIRSMEQRKWNLEKTAKKAGISQFIISLDGNIF